MVRWGRGGIGHYWVRGGELVVNLGGCVGVRVCGCEGEGVHSASPTNTLYIGAIYGKACEKS